MTSANENLPAGMGGLKYPVSQVSLVVNDLHHTMERATHRRVVVHDRNQRTFRHGLGFRTTA